MLTKLNMKARMTKARARLMGAEILKEIKVLRENFLTEALKRFAMLKTTSCRFSASVASLHALL